MFPFRSKETAQRKYIDLIQEAVTKWPNWTPSRIIRAGDYGQVDKKTGEFMYEGNIYTNVDTMQIANQYPPDPGAEVDKYRVHSLEVEGLSIEVAAKLEIPAENIVFGGGWKFNSKRGAVLLMHKAQPTRVPDNFFTAASLHLSALKNMYVVYEVWKCPGYYMYLSSRSSETVMAGLKMNAASANINVTAAFNWVSKGSIGVEQESYRDKSDYVPLFGLRKIRKPDKRRDGNDPQEERWYEADGPWGDLDEDGMTEPEAVHDDDPGDDDDDDDDGDEDEADD